jgi:hypothetical protein
LHPGIFDQPAKKDFFNRLYNIRLKVFSADGKWEAAFRKGTFL